ncbi:MAG: hypothetical protein LQ345_003735 [Seirophora villosa]|nr:MAG: hypothetical protein LQ345_003735 [Seirophora villosa]
MKCCQDTVACLKETLPLAYVELRLGMSAPHAVIYSANVELAKSMNVVHNLCCMRTSRETQVLLLEESESLGSIQARFTAQENGLGCEDPVLSPGCIEISRRLSQGMHTNEVLRGRDSAGNELLW